MKRIPLTQGKFAIVDDADYPEISKYKWCAHKDANIFYAVSRTSRKMGRQKTLRMHRLIMGLRHNDRGQVDHINGNGLDNRRCNLRICTVSQNAMNRMQRKVNNGYKGVVWHKRDKKWQASIVANNKTVYLGYFDDEIVAAAKYNEAAIKYHGEFARLNEIPTAI